MVHSSNCSKNYLVAVYIVLPEKQQPRPATYLDQELLWRLKALIDTRSAAHVWHKGQRRRKNIGLVLTDHQSSFLVPTDGISVKEGDGDVQSSKSGDLILLLGLGAI